MKRFDIEVENGKAYLVGNPEGKYVKYEDTEQVVTEQAHRAVEELLNAMEKLVYKDYNGYYLTAFHGDSVVTDEVERAIELATEYLKTEGEEQ